MAGDWIRMRLDLDEDPAVMTMAERMGVNELCVVGYCWKVWCWVSRQCHADTVTGVTLESLGRVTGTGQFPRLMADVGWLHEVEIYGQKSIKIEKFNRWLSQSSKDRALAAERKKRSRANSVTEMSRSERDKNVTRGEERRGEKSIKEKTPTGSKRKSANADRVHPSLEEVKAFFLERKTDVDPEAFFAYYEARGWRTSGGVQIKNWQQCLTTWEKWDADRRKGSNGKVPEGFRL